MTTAREQKLRYLIEQLRLGSCENLSKTDTEASANASLSWCADKIEAILAEPVEVTDKAALEAVRVFFSHDIEAQDAWELAGTDIRALAIKAMKEAITAALSIKEPGQ